jgi:hypothetical protein
MHINDILVLDVVAVVVLKVRFSQQEIGHDLLCQGCPELPTWSRKSSSAV